MKKIIKMCFAVVLCASGCSNSKTIITEQGSVYKVEDNTIKTKGTTVTDKLSGAKQEAIFERAEEREEQQKYIEDRLNDFEARIEEQEEIISEAEAQKESIEEELEAFEEALENLKDAREGYIELKMELNKKTKEFQKLKDRGELSPNEIKDWNKKIKKLEKDVEKAFSSYKEKKI